ncbi:MAG: ABC transporter substrate-binding protein [Mesoaciditoga sp.]|uniref:ABC transporter substrate-binding protein n=1 Tax=Athalassotoga sp. TaxID=2022597 RepID=UPI000CCB19C0|nr:MAG: ABC transporter substrate-binding protein [Mesoaciditoga sp.]PMP80883.1 MAG: ABC transporter substrate-binding protein [Mesoaciditoga sp.]HEU24002.1 ABC transporter substrate-binding protein [Mesoaciditoga lauensis]
MRRFLLLALVFSFAAMAFSASIPKDTVVIGMNTGIFISFDPAVCYEVEPAIMVMNIYSGLFKLQEINGTIQAVPELAESYDISQDGKTWTFHIRKGVSFANGDPVNADAVVYSVKRVLQLKKSPVWLFESLGLNANNMNETVKKIDDYTVQITMDKSYAPNIVMSIFAESWGGIVDPKVAQSHDVSGDMGSAYLADHSAGAGPYILKSWQRNNMIVLVANDKYWRGAPRIKTIIIRDMPESTDQQLALKRGDIDIAWNLTPEQVNSLKGDPNFNVVSVPAQSNEYLAVNAGWGPFKDVRVRQAVKYAIDYDSIIKNIAGGYAIKVQGFIPYGYLGYVSDMPFDQNISKAKELLAQAGYANGFEVELVTNTTERRRNEAIAIQADLAKIGIKANITIMQASQMYTKMREQGIQMIIAGWGIDFPDPDALAKPFADYRVKQLAWRMMWYDDHAADLAEAAGFELNQTKRVEIYKELTNYWFDNGPFAILYQPLSYWGTRAELKGFDQTAKGYSLAFDLTKMYK